MHLTNDAVQKKGEEYGRFESCNKVSLADFEKYVDASMKFIMVDPPKSGVRFASAYK